MPYLKREGIRFTPKAKPFEGMKQNNYSLYNSPAWRKHRKDYLKRNPLCKMCEAKGLIVEAFYLDHIKPINEGGDEWSEDNQQGLCKQCHSVKSVNDRWRKHNEKQANH